MLLLDDGTVEDYTERADPLTALAHQKRLAEEWRERCHAAEEDCDRLEAERDEWKAKAAQAMESYADAKDARDYWQSKATMDGNGTCPNTMGHTSNDSEACTENYMDDVNATENPRSHETDRKDNVSFETQKVTFDDTREELEADITTSAYMTYYGNGEPRLDGSYLFGVTVWTVFGWLDRQAAITEQKCLGRCCQNHVDNDEGDAIDRFGDEVDE